MDIETVEDLFRYELSAALEMEEQLVRLLTKLVDDVDDNELRNTIEGHIEQSRGHVNRIRRCFGLLHGEPFEVTSTVARAFEEERNAFRSKAMGGWLVLTPYTITMLEKMEHMEVGVYTSLSRLAQSRGHRVCLFLLEETLWEEEQMARKLDQIGRRLLGITESAEVPV